MPSREIAVLRNALAYANVSDSDVKEGIDNLIEKLDADLTELGYEPSVDTDTATTELEDLLNELDNATENLNEAIASAVPEDEEDEDTEDVNT